VAGLGTTFAALPDLIAMLKRRSSKGMNPRMAAIYGGVRNRMGVLRVVDRFTTRDLWNVIAVATNFFSVGAYFYFARHER
jgi:MtN3 and saliva related transmembrane protein